ncbi:MAG: hypothetical protein LWW77_03585, partial [Propionibacteriales bacterium]|nr:hypothetical protein [Propionibacteriales bacterium]
LTFLASVAVLVFLVLSLVSVLCERGLPFVYRTRQGHLEAFIADRVFGASGWKLTGASSMDELGSVTSDAGDVEGQ